MQERLAARREKRRLEGERATKEKEEDDSEVSFETAMSNPNGFLSQKLSLSWPGPHIEYNINERCTLNGLPWS